MSLLKEPEDSRSNYWLNTLRVQDAATKSELLESLIAQKIFARPIWKPMHLLPAFAHCPRAELSATQRCYDTLINVPSSVCLAEYIIRDGA